MTVMVDENITSKYTFALLKVFCDYSVSFTSYNMGEVSQKYRVDIENERSLLHAYVVTKTSNLVISRHRYAEDC